MGSWPGRPRICRHRAETAAALYIRPVGNVEADVIGRKYFVGGRVQGVFYRATVARHARELQVTGHARNLPDGRVEVLAYGSESALEELLRRLWTGSSASKVASVQIVDAAPGAGVPAHFTTS